MKKSAVRKKKSATSSSKISAKSQRVAVVMGSDSDLPVMSDAIKVLKDFGIPTETRILSAHRTPKEMMDFAIEAHKKGFSAIVAGAGGAAHLPGMIASLTILPVIGVPVPHGTLQGQDALLSIVQMPKGVPVATVAIGNAWNAGLLAVQILAQGNSSQALALQKKLNQFKKEQSQKVREKDLSVKKSQQR